MGNRPSLLELLTVKDRPKEDCEFYRTDVALSSRFLKHNSPRGIQAGCCSYVTTYCTQRARRHHRRAFLTLQEIQDTSQIGQFLPPQLNNMKSAIIAETHRSALTWHVQTF